MNPIIDRVCIQGIDLIDKIMPLSLWQRRKFLAYLGLGTIGYQTATLATRPETPRMIG